MKTKVPSRKLSTEDRVVIQDFLLRQRHGATGALATCSRAEQTAPESTVARNADHWRKTVAAIDWLLSMTGYRGVKSPPQLEDPRP